MKNVTARLAVRYYKSACMLLSMFIIAFMATSTAKSIPVLDLGSTANFAVLAGSTVTGIPPVSITGNVGLSPAAGSYIVGFSGVNVVGTLYAVDASGPVGSVINSTLLQTAKSDLTIAYNDAAGRTPVPTGTFLNPGSSNIGGLNLVAGLYKFTSDAAITGSDLTLTGSATDVWIFQIASSLNVGSGIHIILAGGAQAANIFWQVGTSATLGTYSVFKGTILADQSVSMGTGVSLEGRALAFSAAVTMASAVTATKPVLLYPIYSANVSQILFGNVTNLSNKKDSVAITNIGTADLILNSVISSNLLFTVTPSADTLAPGNSGKFYITFSPLASGLDSGKIYFHHNASNALDSVSVRGTGTTALAPIFSANPIVINYGSVIIGANKKDSVTVTNTGTANLVISSITSSNGLFTFTPSSGTIVAGASLKYYITFTPLANGLQSGKIYFHHNAINALDSVAVSGTGTTALAPIFSANPIVINYGSVIIGANKKDSVTVTNTGTANLVISSITSSNGLFTFTPSSGTIAAGASQKYYLTFTPLANGLQSGKIYFHHNAINALDSVAVSGTGTTALAPIFSANPIVINYGSVIIGANKKDSVTVTNTGTANLVISSITSSNGLFTFTPSSGTIAAGASLKYYITFTPSANGLQSGKIYFHHNAINALDSVAVSGTGTTALAPIFSANPIVINYGSVIIGANKKDSVTVTNTGTANLVISSITSSNGLFTFTPSSGTIVAGASLKYYITFTPLANGLQSGKIYFHHNAINTLDSVAVSGTGTTAPAPIFSANPLFLSFGTVLIGANKQDSITVTNTGTANLVISSITSSNGLFTFTPSSGTIAAGASLKYYMTYTPLANGLQSGKIYFHHNATNALDSIPVSGSGSTPVAPIFSANPLVISFGSVNNGAQKQDSVTVTNTGTANLIISSITSSNLLFTFTPSIGTIAPGASLKYYITFSPLVNGLQNGKIYFHHNAGNALDSISVNGNSLSPLFSSTLDFGSVRDGSSKIETVVITNSGASTLIVSSATSTNPLYTISPTYRSIAVDSSAKFLITFSPLVDGVQKAVIYFNHNAANGKDSINVIGKGVSSIFSALPTNINFGSVVNGKSKTDSLRVFNTGTAELIISKSASTNSVFDGAMAVDTIAVGSSKMLYITFSPIIDGVQNGYIYYYHNAKNLLDSISVSGIGISPNFVSNTRILNFGKVNVGLVKSDTVRVSNTGTVDLVISSIIATNLAYTVIPTSGVIAPGATAVYTVYFSPLTLGATNGFIYFYNNAENGSDTIIVTGTGVYPKYSVSDKIVNFGDVVNGESKRDSVVITNYGTADLIIANIENSNIRYSTDISNFTIVPNGVAKMYITFSPIVNGSQNGYIYIRHNSSPALDSIRVNGTGVSPTFSKNTSRINFGLVKINTSKMDSVTVTNNGTSVLNISSITSSNARFSVSPNSGVIYPGSMAKYYITFLPIIDGAKSGTIYFHHNAVGVLDSVNVSGTGVSYDVAPKFSANTLSLDFGTVSLDSMVEKTVTITNTGVVDLIIKSVLVSNFQYSILPKTGAIAPGASQDFAIVFSPSIIGKTDANIRFYSNAGIDTINVTGIGFEDLKLTSIYTAKGFTLGREFIVEGVVTRTLGSYTRIQDNTGALTIYQTSGTFYNEIKTNDIQMGDMIRIHGRFSEMNFLMVVSGIDLISYQRVSRLNTLPTPTPLTIAQLAFNAEYYESRLITLNDLTISYYDDVLFQESKIYQLRDNSDTTNTIVIRIGSAEDTYMDGVSCLKKLAIFEGVLSQSSDCVCCGYQLTPVLSTDIRYTTTGVVDPSSASQTFLSANYPNPFNSSTMIQYNISDANFVSLKIFDLFGKEVAVLVNSQQSAGAHSVQFANDLSLGSGVYYYRLEVGAFVETKQMILVK